MSVEKMREEFEAWSAREQVCSSGDLEFDNARNCYARLPVHIAWQAWQASRAALVVELPGYSYSMYLTRAECNAAAGAVNECRAAIEAAGVTVK